MSLLCIPSEVVCVVLESCSSAQDALALASTCKHLYREWTKHGVKIIWSYWKEEMTGLDEALIAVGSSLRMGYAVRVADQFSADPGDTDCR